MQLIWSTALAVVSDEILEPLVRVIACLNDIQLTGKSESSHEENATDLPRHEENHHLTYVEGDPVVHVADFELLFTSCAVSVLNIAIVTKLSF